MSGRSQVGSRLPLALLGMLVAAAGVVGLALHFDAFGESRRRTAVLLPAVRAFVRHQHAWFWWAAGAAAVVLAIAGAAWLRAQIHLPLPGNDDLVRTSDQGRVVVHGGAGAAALAQRVEQLPGVEAAVARVAGHEPDAPSVFLRVDVRDDASIDHLREIIESDSLEELRRVMQAPRLDARVVLRLTAPSGRDLR